MGRVGRPKKELTPTDIEKMNLTDDIVNQLKFNAKLSEDQIQILKNTLDNTPAFVGVPSDEEKTIYTNFADSLMNAVANRCSDSTIALSEENVLSGLDSIVEENYYAECIQNVPDLISIFISGNYRYHTKTKISTEVVRDFRQWFGRVPSRTKDVILKSLRARLKMVAIFDPIEDSMPF